MCLVQFIVQQQQQAGLYFHFFAAWHHISTLLLWLKDKKPMSNLRDGSRCYIIYSKSEIYGERKRPQKPTASPLMSPHIGHVIEKPLEYRGIGLPGMLPCLTWGHNYVLVISHFDTHYLLFLALWIISRMFPKNCHLCSGALETFKRSLKSRTPVLSSPSITTITVRVWKPFWAE